MDREDMEIECLSILVMHPIKAFKEDGIALCLRKCGFGLSGKQKIAYSSRLIHCVLLRSLIPSF